MRKFCTHFCMLLITLFVVSNTFATSLLTPMSDAVNSGIINTKMAASDALNHTNVDATVVNGVAIFSGDVNSTQQVDTLIGIAHSVSGIKSVDTTKIRITAH